MGVYAHNIGPWMPKEPFHYRDHRLEAMCRDAMGEWEREQRLAAKSAPPNPKKKRGPRKPKRGTARQDAAEQRQKPATIVLTVAFGDWSVAGLAKIERVRQDISKGLASICGGIQCRRADDRHVAQDRLELTFHARPRQPLTESSILGSLSSCGVQVTAARVVGKTPVPRGTQAPRLSREQPKPDGSIGDAALQREVAFLRSEVARLKEQNALLMEAIRDAGQALREKAGEMPVSNETEVSDEPEAPARRAFRTPF